MKTYKRFLKDFTIGIFFWLPIMILLTLAIEGFKYYPQQTSGVFLGLIVMLIMWFSGWVIRNIWTEVTEESSYDRS